MAYKNVQVIDKPEFLEVSDFDFISISWRE